jgi:nucleotide-binding universal stress UspA family protein
MPYKTILVHLNNERRSGPLMEYATGLGENFASHIVGLYVFPAFRLTPPVPMPFSKELAGTLRGEMREEERRIRSLFQAATKGYSNVSEWRSVTTERKPVGDVVLEHARAADIVVASQADPEWGFSDILDCPDRLAIESGRPVIILPRAGRFNGNPRTILVAWNGKREAARAVFDAIPLLGSAESIEVLTIDERAKDETSLPDTEIAAGLSRHGVHVRLSRSMQSAMPTAKAIVERAAELKADLLVTGAYGHSRMTEFVFGGVTRHLLHEATIPVLFSH